MVRRPPSTVPSRSPAACRVLQTGAGKSESGELVGSGCGELPELGAPLRRESAEVPGLKPVSSPHGLLPIRVRGLESERELQQHSISGHGHCWSPLSRMMNPGVCCPERSPERVEGPAAGNRQKMTGTGTTRSGSRCHPLFLLLLLGSSCHMLHGQGKSFYSQDPWFQMSRRCTKHIYM